MKCINEVAVNGSPGTKSDEEPSCKEPRMPRDLITRTDYVTAKNVLDTGGADALVEWIKGQKNLLLTGTTFRNAHQSLLTTCVRTKDFKQVAHLTEEGLPELSSSEMWGGATFGATYRFLNEDLWQWLRKIRSLMPSMLLQVLFRGSNAAEYSNYPDNVLVELVKEVVAQGIDVFRIFNNLDWIPQMEKNTQAVRDIGKITKAVICYTGDINSPSRVKHNVQYYKDMVKELEQLGTHIVAIKDMTGLFKLQAAHCLISELKETTDLPIHLHTHDINGGGIITYSATSKAGVDIVDVVMSAMSGNTSQPSMSSLYYALINGPRLPEIMIENAQKLDHYWEDVRMCYKPSENDLNVPETKVRMHEMPGGQYPNLQQQAETVGLGHRWDEIKQVYHTVGLMFGDIVRVALSSKVVGDITPFMV